jgi:multiple sugar transport system permease protein
MTVSNTTTPAPGWLRFQHLSRRQKKALQGYLFISPWIIGFLVFVVGPLIASAVLSFYNYNLLTPPQFTGFDNFDRILNKDPLFWRSVRLTIGFAITAVTFGLSGSLACAMLLTSGLRGTNFFRTAFFIPSLTPIVAATIIWQWLFQPGYGPINGMLAAIGIEGPGWLDDPNWSIPSLIIIRLWITVGGATMIVFIAGLQGIPEELYDAAKVDGANGWSRFRFVTLPMLTPTIFFNLIIGVIGALKVFTIAFIATATDGFTTPGGPAYSTYVYLLHVYQNAFIYLQMGYASALAWLFFIAVLVLTIIQFGLSRRWVYYEAGDQ